MSGHRADTNVLDDDALDALIDEVVAKPTSIPAASGGGGRLSENELSELAAELSAECPTPSRAAPTAFGMSPTLARAVHPVAPAPARGADGLDALLGMREAARVRAVLARDATRIARSSGRRRRMSRGYRASDAGPEVEALSAASAAAHAAWVAREALGKAGKSEEEIEDVETVVGSERMGAMLAMEIETAVRQRLASDPDFDPALYPQAAKRFCAA